ncbi:hypothetical protein FSP39_014999 [Pinctada imbricata]|uniref:BRCT domain-containing protein n=1 Tax=Pinctada imbricata TaxID=66713 RepID=A0AA88XWV7_PINIB|nr:hypothetical protein FSP39_014999 [Pinctada imbricata]
MEVAIHIMPQKIEKQRREHMMNAAKRHKIKVENKYNSQVTHIVTECETRDQALTMLKISPDAELPAEIVNVKWFVESMKAKRPVPVTDDHRVKIVTTIEESTSDAASIDQPVIAEWSCLRSTPLKHYNQRLCDALGTLQKFAELRDGDSDYSRALAFCRASCVLKTLTHTLTDVREIEGVKDIGKHVLRVLKEILEEGYSEEVESIRNNPWYQKMVVFDSIFGVGSATAKRWINLGISSIKEAKQKYRTSDWRVNYGLAFYEELNDLVVRNEAENFKHFVATEAKKILPGVMIELTGGFRRGKQSGHDVDLLFTHKHEGKEKGFLEKLLKELTNKGLILRGWHEKNTFSEEVLYKDTKLSMKGQLDHFEKWIGIMKFPKSWKEAPCATANPGDAREEDEGNIGSLHSSYEESCEPDKKRQKLNPSDDESPYELAHQERDWEGQEG